jgi:Spy/CpxP family protein refolding chaperone
MKQSLALSALCLFTTISLAQGARHEHSGGHSGGHGGGHGAGAAAQAPHGAYAGWHHRRIKALSEQQVDDLRAGRGMSLALPAELNGYPGPAHVLELAKQLQLTPEQVTRTRALFEQMQREAQAGGQAVIEAEERLDRLFHDKQATPAALTRAVAEAATAMGSLRETHLRYHLSMMEVLTPMQVSEYQRLRGYRAAS